MIHPPHTLNMSLYTFNMCLFTCGNIPTCAHKESNILWVRISFGIFCCLMVYRFSSGPGKCRILQHLLAKLAKFALACQHPPHVQTTSPASSTNRGEQNPKSSWRVEGVEKVMIQIGWHISMPATNLKSSGVLGGAAAPPVMFEPKGEQWNLCKKSKKVAGGGGGGGGGAAACFMMFEEVMIQIGVQANLTRKSRGGGRI